MTESSIDYEANDVKDQFYEGFNDFKGVAGLLSSKKGFYVGDICYVLGEEVYHEYWGRKKEYKDGVYKENDFQFAVAGTAYGDGEYIDNHGNVYGVDAGVIGIVPYETIVRYGRKGRINGIDGKPLSEQNIIGMLNQYGAFYEGETASFIAENGVFEMEVGRCGIYIDTGDCGEDEE